MDIIIINTLLAVEAETILKNAERALRANRNLHGFRRIDSGFHITLTDGFGNPYGVERELRVYGISIEVPDGMDRQTAIAYIRYGGQRTNCYAEYYFA